MEKRKKITNFSSVLELLCLLGSIWVLILFAHTSVFSAFLPELLSLIVDLYLKTMCVLNFNSYPDFSKIGHFYIWNIVFGLKLFIFRLIKKQKPGSIHKIVMF